LQARAIKLKAQEDEQRALDEELGLLPDTRAFHHVMRYTAVADRKVRYWMQRLRRLLRRASKQAE